MADTDKIIALEALVIAQKELEKELTAELRRIALKNLRLKMHMQVLVSHPVGIATKIIVQKYSPEKITKELQLSTQN